MGFLLLVVLVGTVRARMGLLVLVIYENIDTGVGIGLLVLVIGTVGAGIGMGFLLVVVLAETVCA